MMEICFRVLRWLLKTIIMKLPDAPAQRVCRPAGRGAGCLLAEAGYPAGLVAGDVAAVATAITFLELQEGFCPALCAIYHTHGPLKRVRKAYGERKQPMCQVF